MDAPQIYPPSDQFAAHAVAHAELYDEAAADRLAFWARQARERLEWARHFTETLTIGPTANDSDSPRRAPAYRWFPDGTLNASVNAVDRHVQAGLGERVAIHWEGEPGDTRTLTYRDLQDEVGRAANVLTELGVGAGDRVAIYLPLIPEAAIAMLACARVGAVHSVVFGGFSAEALRSRIIDAGAKLVITADGGYRRGAASALKPAVDEALSGGDGETDTVEHVLVVRRTGQDVGWAPGRDLWWHEAMSRQSTVHFAQHFPSEHPLFILYTSGTTGKPKGIYHSTGGYLTQAAYTHSVVFDLRPESDVYWCTADVGWITGHTYVVYGPLLNGATQVMYEGTPDTPGRDRWWEIVEKYKVSILYTAPTAIRTCMKWGDDVPAQHDLSSLRVLGSVGEPINPEAWRWYRRTIGADSAPVVDTWWQTETGGIMISPLPGVSSAKPGSAGRPLPGISAAIVNDRGEEIEGDERGYLVLTEPWPGIARGIWGDPERFYDTYWARFPGRYFAGDGARRDDDGDFWLLGRVDDVMNVSGHRLSTAEVESALVAHPWVAEAAVVGANDETTGQAIVAFVILRGDADPSGDDGEPLAPGTIGEMLRTHVAHSIGPIARPRTVLIVPELPKTRSGKIMRRLLRDVAENREVGDATTLADSTVMASIAKQL